jgi:broad specificity phosphatase PhoE
VPTILLVRHGQASFGAADYDVLSPLGQQQSRALDAELQRRGARVDRVVCGTLRRQRDTVATLAAAGRPSIDPRLNEYDSDGILIAHTDSALRQQSQGPPPPDVAAASRSFQTVLDDGLRAWIAAGTSGPAAETYPAFAGRVRQSIEGVAAGLQSGQTALICTSSGVISAACTALMGLPDEAFIAFNRVTVNAGITTIAVGRGGRTLVSFNEHGYLEAAGESLLSYR